MSTTEFDTDFGIDIDDVDPDRIGGFTKVKEGGYHFEVEAVNPKMEKSGDMMVESRVCMGTEASEIGKTHREYYQWPTGDISDKVRHARRSAILAFYIAVKLTTADEIKALQEQHKQLQINPELALGRPFKGQIKHREWEKDGNKGVSVELGFNVWTIDSSKAAWIPVNQGKLATAGDAAADPFDGVF